MTKYLKNILDGTIVEDTGNLGRSFRNGDWKLATEEEVNNFLLKELRAKKLLEVKKLKLEKIEEGITYNFGNTDYTIGINDNYRDNLRSILIICNDVNLFYFDDINKNSIDFENKENLQDLYKTIFLKRTQIRNREKELENLINNCNDAIYLNPPHEELENPEEEGYIIINFNQKK